MKCSYPHHITKSEKFLQSNMLDQATLNNNHQGLIDLGYVNTEAQCSGQDREGSQLAKMVVVIKQSWMRGMA